MGWNFSLPMVEDIYPTAGYTRSVSLLEHPTSGVITSCDVADSPVMKKMDDNRGLKIIRDASHKHIQPLTLAYFRRDLIKIW